MNDDGSNSNSSKRKEDPNGKSNAKLEEYLAVMQPPKKSKTWADDSFDTAIAPPVVPAEPVENDSTELPERESKRRKIERQEQSTNITPSRPHTTHNADSSQDTDQTQELPDRTLVNDGAEAASNDTPVNAEHQVEEKTDADWLRSKTSRLLGLIDDDEQAEMSARAQERKAESVSSDDDADGPNQNPPNAYDSKSTTQSGKPADEEEKEEPQEEVDTNIDMIRNTGRLFVRNLPYHADEAGLEAVFSPFGKLEEVSHTSVYHPSSPFVLLCHHGDSYDDHPDRDI